MTITLHDGTPDFSAVKKLASALWRESESFHGAALMVGAGFSRCAATTDGNGAPMPLWKDLSAKLRAELASNTEDPLRLAEEYCAFFGRQALRDLVRRAVNDPSRHPGALHKAALELPWSEVLTTNWDTLLERASVQVHHPIYSVIAKDTDLSSERAPRIVKLHGTIGGSDLIVSQEDYRSYPLNHAAFVNFARHVFIENELCLVGFSGDDPNFLQWAGWVRDHLASHSRRIYLVGVLGLSPSNRKYLESINVAPIDLAEVVSEYDPQQRHVAAMTMFFESLVALRPKPLWDWTPERLHRSTLSAEEANERGEGAHGARRLEAQIPALAKTRETYPGWVVCPQLQRVQLRGQISDPFVTAQNVAALTETDRARLLYEIAWQRGVTFDAVEDWLAQEMLKACVGASSVITQKQQAELAMYVLRNARWMGRPAGHRLEQQARSIVLGSAKHWPEGLVELKLFDAGSALDRFDYPELESILETLAPADAGAKLRTAALLAELGSYDKAEGLLEDAYQDLLGQHRRDQRSIYVLSRLAWAEWLMLAVDRSRGKDRDRLSAKFHTARCSPWDTLEELRERTTRAIEMQQDSKRIEPSFEPGRFRDHSSTFRFSGELHPLLLLEGICRQVGVPLRWRNVSLLTKFASRVGELAELDEATRVALVVRASESEDAPVLNSVFSRVSVAQFSGEGSHELVRQCQRAIEFWLKRPATEASEDRRFSQSRLRVHVEVLARVSLRMAGTEAAHLAMWACALTKHPGLHNRWLAGPLSHLVKYAISCNSTVEQSALLSDALSIPLPHEIGLTHEDWLDVRIESIGARAVDSNLDLRIDQIIASVAPCSSRSATALHRLLPLCRSSFLSGSESARLSEAVWGAQPTYETLPKTGLLKHALLSLPSTAPEKVRSLVHAHLYGRSGASLFSLDHLQDIVGAARASEIAEQADPSAAARLFLEMTEWRPKEPLEDAFFPQPSFDKWIAALVGEALAYAIVPSLAQADLTETQFIALEAFDEQVEAPATLIAMAQFAARDEAFVTRVEKRLRQALRDLRPLRVGHAAQAVLDWRMRVDAPVTRRLASMLLIQIAQNRLTGLTDLLRVARELHNADHFTQDEIDSLGESTVAVFDSSGYNAIDPSSREAISSSLVRAECVRVARDLLPNLAPHLELTRLLQEAVTDALPEVRLAVQQE